MDYPGDVEHAFAMAVLDNFAERALWGQKAALCQVIADWLEERGDALMAGELRKGQFALARKRGGGPWRFVHHLTNVVGRDIELGMCFYYAITPERLEASTTPPFHAEWKE